LAYRIIVLTKKVEAPFLQDFLQNENPNLEIKTALDEVELREKVGNDGSCTRLLCFNSPIIVPKDILDELGPAPYNIHPGPPEYPGSYPIAFALKDNALKYGATAHEMIEKVDAGPIVYVCEMPIAADINLEQLTELAFNLGIEVFRKIAVHCAHSTVALPHLDRKWGKDKSTRKAYLELCKVPANASAEEIRILQRICGDDLIKAS